jgi:hypothetical protein
MLRLGCARSALGRRRLQPAATSSEWPPVGRSAGGLTALLAALRLTLKKDMFLFPNGDVVQRRLLLR